jgi:hypothetical protein
MKIKNGDFVCFQRAEVVECKDKTGKTFYAEIYPVIGGVINGENIEYFSKVKGVIYLVRCPVEKVKLLSVR